MRTDLARTRAGAALALTLAATAELSVGCRREVAAPPSIPPEASVVAQLWVRPTTSRDLLHGPGGAALAPDPASAFDVIALKVGGFSRGYTVRDAEGQEWSVKFPPEASTEVVASRVLWGAGFHQPPMHFVREWDARNATTPNPQLPGRFRPKKPDFHGLDEKGSWSYYDNPFIGTRQLAGLLVIHAMLGNSDLKDSNNSVYELETPAEGARRWFVARDIGQTFGRSGVFSAPRGDVAVFEQTRFVVGVEGARVRLEYNGRHRALFENLTVDDVRWACAQLDRLTDAQWLDAFRAGGYDRATADRFIRHLEKKVAQGLALRAGEEHDR
jgi:hypothetical protein